MAQVEVTVNTVQEGYQAITDAVVERWTKARGPGCPQGMMKATQAPTTAYNIEEWIQGMEEEALKVEARNSAKGNHVLEQRSVCWSR